jgi:hypothetical protein
LDAFATFPYAPEWPILDRRPGPPFLDIRLAFVASIERTAYPRFNASLFERELKALYEPTPGELAFAKDSTRSSRGELTLLVLLK